MVVSELSIKNDVKASPQAKRNKKKASEGTWANTVETSKLEPCQY